MQPSSASNIRATIHIRNGDLRLVRDQAAVLELLDHYASHLAGRMAPLAPEVRANLIPALQSQANCRIFFAETSDRIVGMALCFIGFSTFKARSLLNIHDLTVHSDFRNQGIGERLLSAASQYARQSGYCAVTLEVQAGNPARRLYARHGFQWLEGEHNDAATLFGKLEIH